MAGNPVGTLFVELDMDTAKYTKAQKEILASAHQSSLDIETNFKRLGGTSDAMYQAMRQKAENAYAGIANSAKSSADEIRRAQEALHAKQKQLDEQQFGRQTSMLDTMKKNWVATSAVVAGAWLAVNKAMAWAEIGAKAQQAEESFRIVAAAAGESSEKIIEGMKRAAAGTVDDSDIMQKAVKGMVLGLKGDEMIHIMEASRVAARVAGEDVKTAYENITNAIATGMPRALKKYGLATKEETAIVEEALKAGVEGINLYTLAMTNAEIQSAKMGAMQRNAAEGTQYFHAQVHELTETIGKFVIELSTGVFATLKTFAGLLSFVAAPIAYLIGGTEAYNAMVASGNDLLIQAGKLAGHNAEETKKNVEADAAAANATVERLQKEKAAWIEKLKAQIGAKQAAKDAAALEKEIWNMQLQIAAAVQKIRDDMQKREMDALKFNREEANRLFNEQAKGTEEYQKIVTEAQDWSISEHQRAINKILSGEATTIARIYELWEAGTINLAQLDEGMAAVRVAAGIAREAQLMKELSAQESFYSTIEGFEREWFDKKVELINREKDMRIAAGWDVAAANAAANQAIGRARIDLFDKEHAGINAILAATKVAAQTAVNLFKEGSRERQIAHNLEMAATIAELAIQAQKNIMIAVGAVAQQGSGDPYSAFARIAAMISVMTSVLAMAGIAFGGGGGGGGSSAPILPQSTVLGAEAGTGSESIGKVWELLEDTYDLEYRELTGIHNVIKDLNRNITGLVSAFLRGGGGFEAGEFNLGFSPGMAESFTSKYISGFTKVFSLGLLDSLPGANYISSLAGKVFGGGKTSSLEGAGIEFKAQSVGDLVAGEYMDAVGYALIKTVKSGGWFRKDKTSYSTIYEALDADVSRLFTLVFQNMSTTLVELAKELGGDVNAVLAYTFKGERLDLAGKTGEEIQKTLSEYFSKVGDVAVREIFGDLVAGYQQLNEGLFETAARLVIDKAIVSEILTMTNQGLPGTTAQIIAFSESLIAMAGGLDVLQEASATYYDKFFTDAEKQARLQGQLSGAFGDLGMTLPGSRSGYRALVEGLDLTTEAGKEAYVALLKWSQAADDYYSALGDNLDMQNNLTASLEKQSETIARWLEDLNKGALAPVMSAQAQEAAYARAREAAFAPGAAEADTNAFLTAASEYLKFSRSYSGDYAGVYQMVTGDVQRLADAIALALTQTTLPTHGGGGLTRGPTITGEIGREWNVPTYEPQRSRFLESAPPQFWENLRGGGVVQGGGGGGPDTLNINLVLDGKVLARSQVKNLKSDGALAEATRRMN